MIRTEHLCKYYSEGGHPDVRAVDDVSLNINAGTFVVLTGGSGSGKTTLLSLLGAISRPTSGSIVLNGHELGTCSDVELARIRQSIGFVFQNFSLLPGFPAWENVTYQLIPRGLRSDRRFEIAHEVLQQLGMADRIQHRTEQLSGGEQQRLAIARALASKPRILVADEPTSNLDQRSAAELTEIFQKIHSTGVTLIMSTHSSTLIELATDSYEMSEGRIICR